MPRTVEKIKAEIEACKKELALSETAMNALKVTVNGSFGKFGSPYSVLYSPDLLVQVTVTGQLSLLMLIQWMESQGISVVSANTDGVVVKCPKSKEELMVKIEIGRAHV